MTIRKIRCAVCGENLSLKGQTVSCTACQKRGSHTATGSLAQTILAIETQAAENGQTLDISSIATDGRGHLTFSVKTLVGASFASRAETMAGRKRAG